MKKITSILLIMLLIVSLCSCSGSGNSQTPDFEEKNVQWISVSSAMKNSDVRTYRTVCEKDPAAVTEGSVNVYCEPCDAPEGFKTPDGYAWQRLRMRMSFGDEAANEGGYRYCYFMTDYYGIDLLNGSLSFDDSRQCDTFTVRWEDKKYKKCVAMISKAAEDWVMDEESGLQSCSEILTWTVLLPEGYDGICCCLYDAALQAQVEGSANFTNVYDPAAFLIYRLDAVK
jgi:hypothetical protein